MKIQCISIYQVCGPSQTITTRKKPDKFLTERKSDDFRYMNFHISKIIIRHLDVCLDPIH